MCTYRLFRVDRDDQTKLEYTGKTIELNRKSIQDNIYPPLDTVSKIFALFNFKSIWDGRYTASFLDSNKNTISIQYHEGYGHNRCWILKRGI